MGEKVEDFPKEMREGGEQGSQTNSNCLLGGIPAGGGQEQKRALRTATAKSEAFPQAEG